MYPFTYHRPDSVSAAAQLADDAEAKVMAGGMTLLPTMKQRLAAPAAIIDLNGVSGLAGVTVSRDKVTIGAMTRHADVHTSEDLRKAIPALAELAGLIGDPVVRHRGTIGGSVANNDPAADYPAACMALGATIVTDRREIAAEDFFTGLFDTALEQGELSPRSSSRFRRKPPTRNSATRPRATPSSACSSRRRAAGVRVAVTGAGESGVFRVKSFEDALTKDFSAKAIEAIKVSPDGLNSDIHADAVYRAHLINVMARRAVTAAG